MRKIVIVGAGTMGRDIAQVFASKGFTVTVNDIGEEILANAGKNWTALWRGWWQRKSWTQRKRRKSAAG